MVDVNNKFTSSIMKLVKEEVSKILGERGNWKEYNQKTDNELDFLIVYESKSSPETYSLISNLKNIITREEVNKIRLKDVLYLNLLQKYKYKPYLLETYYYNKKTDKLSKFKHLFDNKKIWLIKPIYSRSGIGISSAKSYNELIHYFRDTTMGDRYVIQEYIMNPLLYQRKKFHLRFYFMFYGNSVYLYNKAPVAKASLNYVKRDFSNQDIHDTHFKGDFSTFFPQDFKGLTRIQKNKIMEDVKHMTLDISNLVSKECYKENKNCYQMFAMDVMITKDLQIKLLETAINFGRVTTDKKKLEEIYKEMLQSAFIEIVDPLFPPEKVPNQKSYFTKIK